MVWLELLSDYTFQNVVMGASLLGLISGPLGCFAVLRRQSLLGDAISHAALPGICLRYWRDYYWFTDHRLRRRADYADADALKPPEN